ncbi:head GIN domain-containing protein [Flavobacterium sp. CS20]|uniref:head GIN domain-containing protein n=1 Tax=Flavobacterium sp. CS20 TaxID=2775246 RepID=UPI001B39D8C3|nr:head GIN domain-containing protein [Flavobacterium sp. CS20]QTY27039.1 DUF2807 domain-containing protein [Flavobacterium sp. CS20]
MTTLVKYLSFAILIFNAQCNIDGYNTIKGEGEVTEKEFELSRFEELSLANAWDIKLVQADENKLVIKANKNLIEELKIDQDDLKLKIGTKSKDNIGKADSKLLTIYFADSLTHLKASSGINLFAKEQLNFNDINISSSSGSDVELNVKSQKLNCSSSSGSDMKLKISSTDVVANSSSGSDLHLIGKIQSLQATSSSGSDLNIEGYTDELTANSSSGSDIEAKNLKAINVTATASSGSTINVYPLEVLVGSASSGSDIIYHNKPSVKLDKNESSGGDITYR